MKYRNPIEQAWVDGNIGLRELSKRTGIDIATVCRISNGDAGMSVDQAESIAKALSIPMSELAYMTTAEYHKDKSEAYENVQDKFRKLAALVSDIKAKHKRGESGVQACPTCGGILHWSLSVYNGHAHIFCETPECTAVME